MASITRPRSPGIAAFVVVAWSTTAFFAGPSAAGGGRDSNTVPVFAIDPKTGTLSFTGRSIDVPIPVCIRFRPAPPNP